MDRHLFRRNDQLTRTIFQHSPVVVEVLRLRDIARRLGDVAEHVLAGRRIAGNPWIDLLCEQDEEWCAG